MRLPNRATGKSILRGMTVLLITMAGLFATIGPANAARTYDTELGQVQTLAGGGVLCGGSIRVWATTNPDWGDRSILNAQAQSWTGLSSGSAFAGACRVGVRVAWRNLTTGASGEWRFDLVAGAYGSMQYALFQPTGRGKVVTDVTTESPHLPSRGEFTA